MEILYQKQNNLKMLKKVLVLTTVFVCAFGILSSSIIASAQEDYNIPAWIKNNAGWWANGLIDDNSFVSSIQWLISNDVMIIPPTEQGVDDGVNVIPDWIKNNAGWWAEEKVSDNEFLNSLEFLINKGIIQIKAEESELQILLQKRENLIDFIWKDDGFPTRLPDSIEQNIFDKNFDDLKNLKKIDRITVEMKHEINSVAYLLHPKELSHDDLIIYHNGHNDELHAGKKQIRFLLDRGYPVLVFTMPFAGMNPQPVIMIDGEEIKLDNHAKFKLLESDKFSPISYFVEPIAVSLNFIDKNFDYAYYHMIGISGGGWTAVIYPAIDQRISHTTSVAGSIPLELRILERDMGDYEQRLPELYQIANYYDLYVLASFGTDRKLTQIFNFDDECCFAVSDGKDLSYENEIKNRLANLGSGKFDIIIDMTHHHFISGTSLMSFYFDIDEKNVQDFHDLKLREQNNDFSGSEGNEREFSGVNFSNADFSASKFSNVDFSNFDLTTTNFFSTNFESINLTNADMTNSDFSYSNLCKPEIEKTTIHNVDFTKAEIFFADFTKSDLKNTKFDYSVCVNCIFDQIDISEIRIDENNYHPTSFAGSSFKNVDFRGWEHGNVDFGSKTIKICTSESPTVIPGSDLSGSNLSGLKFERSNFKNTDLTNTDLSKTRFVNVDLTGANLAGADLTFGSFSYSNLSGVSLDDVIIDRVNFGKADISDLDFTVIEHKTIHGAKFTEANMSNSNFEDLSFAPSKIFAHIHKNKANVMNFSDDDLIKDLYPKINANILLLTKQIVGNDIRVEIVLFNNFAGADLENTNLKNTDLRWAAFYESNLTGADLSGADLTNTYLGYANLTNANLSGANLQDAILDDAILTGANLKCNNHPICKSD